MCIDQQRSLAVATGGRCTIFWYHGTAELQDAVEGKVKMGKAKYSLIISLLGPSSYFLEMTVILGKGLVQETHITAR